MFRNLNIIFSKSLYLVLFVFSAQNTFSQVDHKLSLFDTIYNDAEIFFIDAASFYTYPLKNE